MDPHERDELQVHAYVRSDVQTPGAFSLLQEGRDMVTLLDSNENWNSIHLPPPLGEFSHVLLYYR